MEATLPIDEIIKANSGISLDIGCGEAKQPGWVGMDIRHLPGVDIVHDLNSHPWPLPDGSVSRALASHVVEHIPPVMMFDGETHFLFMEFMNEVWRVMKVDGQFAIIVPHANSVGYSQDPTHCNPCNEVTWAYFAPGHPAGLYYIYKPKPWRITHLSWSPVSNIEILLEKIEEIENVGS